MLCPNTVRGRLPLQTAALVFLAAATRTRVVSADLALPRREHNVDTLPSGIRKDKNRSSCFCGFPAQYSIAPCSGRAEAMLGTPAQLSTACCWRLPSTSAPIVQHRTRGKSGPPWRGAQKSPPVKDADPASFFACHCRSLAGHSDSANKPRLTLTQACTAETELLVLLFRIGSRFLSRFIGEKWFRQ